MNESNMETKVREAISVMTNSEERTGTFTHKFKVRGRNKTGTFVFKYPSVMDRAKIGVTRAKMMDGVNENSLDQLSSDIIFTTAFINVLCIKHPNWFVMDDIDDPDILFDIYKGVSNWIGDFRQKMEANEDDGHSDTARNETYMEGNEVIRSSNNS